MRTKTRGGRDQDRWRKIENRIRLRKWMRPRLFVNGFEVEYKALATGAFEGRPVYYSCHRYPPSVEMTLTDNPDCDFAKGGE